MQDGIKHNTLNSKTVQKGWTRRVREVEEDK